MTPHGTTDETKARDAAADAVVRRTEIVISTILRMGVVASAIIVGIGALDFFLRGQGLRSGSALTLAFPQTIGAVFVGLPSLRGENIMALGLLVLIATPVMRVAASIVAFAIERDWRYTAITAVVFCILMLSFALGKAGA